VTYIKVALYVQILPNDSSLMEPKRKYTKKEAVLAATFYRKHIHTLISTFVYLKLFNFERPRWHGPEKNAELAINAKKIVSSMFPPISVIHETN